MCSCRQYDHRTVHIYVPEMKNSACVNVVMNALGKHQGLRLKQISVDLADRVVSVRYDSIRRSVKNIEYTIADAGFAANDVPTTPEAINALPSECDIPKVPVNARTSGRRMW